MLRFTSAFNWEAESKVEACVLGRVSPRCARSLSLRMEVNLIGYTENNVLWLTSDETYFCVLERVHTILI